MLKKFICAAALATIASSAMSGPLTMNKDWEGRKVKSSSTSGYDVCFVASFPKAIAAEPANASFDREAMTAISFRPAEQIANELSFKTGLPSDLYIRGSVKVDNNASVRLLVYQGTGYPIDHTIEEDLVAQMKKGREMEVTWVMESGEKHYDRYSLMGLTKSYAFASACK
mgnify:CR=1 FL=1